MITVGVDQYFSNSDIFKHRFLEILGSYKNRIVAVMTNSRIRPSWKLPYYLLLGVLLTTVQQMLTNHINNKSKIMRVFEPIFRAIDCQTKKDVHRLTAAKN